MEKNIIENEHSLYLSNRKNLSLSGVKDLLAFDENSVSVISIMGNIVIRGANIKIGSFNTDTGDMQIEGEFSAIIYLDNQNGKESFFKKLWR